MSTARPQTPTIPTPIERSIPSILTRPIEAVAFWASVLVALAYPVLLYGGLGGDELLPFVAAITIHVAALRVGRGYDPAA